MTEKIPSYATSTPNTLEAFRNRPCALDVDHDDFVQPTPEEVKSLARILGFTQTTLARFVGVSWNSKGSTTVRRWQTPKSKPEYRAIPRSAWKLMLIKAGLVSI